MTAAPALVPVEPATATRYDSTTLIPTLGDGVTVAQRTLNPFV